MAEVFFPTKNFAKLFNNAASGQSITDHFFNQGKLVPAQQRTFSCWAAENEPLSRELKLQQKTFSKLIKKFLSIKVR